MRRTINLILIFLIFVVVIMGNLFAYEIKAISPDKNITVKIKVSTNTVIGDIFDYKLKIEYAPFILLEDFTPVDNLNFFELKDYRVRPPKKKNIFSKNVVRKYQYKISTFLKGTYKISGLTIHYKIGDKNYVFQTKDILITVTGVFDENDKKNYYLKDIKGMLKIIDPKMYFLIGFMVIIFVGCFYYFFIYKKKAKLVEEKKILPAHEIAFRKLNDLKNSDLFGKNEIKMFYVLLTEIFREYLENRYLIEVLDKTTYEVYYQLKEIGFDRNRLTELREFLEEADLVKFAKYIPDEKMIKNDFDFVCDFVDRTKKIEVVDEIVDV